MNVLDSIKIHCPYCKAMDVDANVGVPSKECDCHSIEDAKKLLVQCCECRMLFDLDLAGKYLHQVSAQTLELAGAVRYRSNPLGKALVISGLYVNLFPGGGILFAMVTIVANWRAKKWLRWISWINFILSIIWTFIFFYAINHW